MAAPLDRLGDLFRKFPRKGGVVREGVVGDGVGARDDGVVAAKDAGEDGVARDGKVVGDGVTFKDPVGSASSASAKDVLDDHPSPRDVPGNKVP
jgi:hypothetical protein